MNRILCTCALLLTMLTTACSGVFEDVGTDPHPPTMELLGLVHYVPPPEEPPPPPDEPPLAFVVAKPGPGLVAWDSGGFTVHPGELFQVSVAYADRGGDIMKLVLRDRDGAFKTELVPTDQTYFPGTSGSAVGPAKGLELTGVVGPHRFELWAEDSHLSRSEKTEFVITLAY